MLPNLRKLGYLFNRATMEHLNCQILLISPVEHTFDEIHRILSHNGYELVLAHNGEEGIQKAIDLIPNLIICENDLKDDNGFRVYQLLREHLTKNGIPFFLYLDNLSPEDLAIGLELGIDNFISAPLDETNLLHKIENQIRKIEEIRAFEMESFKINFESSPVAKFMMAHNRIKHLNPACCQSLHLPETPNAPLLLKDVFNIQENPANKLAYRKFISGLNRQCLLKEVACLGADSRRFDLLLCYCRNIESGQIYAEVVPSNTATQNNCDDLLDLHLPLHTLNERHEKVRVKLTPREIQVLELSARGLPIKQIAARLSLSERTVEKHRANIMGKTHTNNMVEVVYKYQQNHLHN